MQREPGPRLRRSRQLRTSRERAWTRYKTRSNRWPGLVWKETTTERGNIVIESEWSWNLRSTRSTARTSCPPPSPASNGRGRSEGDCMGPMTLGAGLVVGSRPCAP